VQSDESAIGFSRSALFRLEKTCEWCERRCSAHPWRCVGIFLAILFGISLVQSVIAKMWIDEFYTYFAVHQPTVAGVYRALKSGIDSTPPAYALLLRSLRPVLGYGVLDLRLPSIAGFCLMCVCVFAFVYRRLPALYALLAMLFACVKMLHFATDGRPYGLVLGLSALALLCWQAAAEGRYRSTALPILTLSLWSATALHYYSITLLIPLFAAEIVRQRSSKKFDIPMLAALAAAPLVLIPHIPLIQAQRRFIPHFYSRPSLHSFIDFYGDYARYGALLAFPLLVFLIFRARRATEPATRGSCRTMPVYEWALSIALIVLPVAIIVGSMLTIKAFVDRYVMLAVLGFSALAAALLCRIARANAAVAVFGIVLLLLGFSGKAAIGLKNAPRLHDSEALSRMLPNAPDDGSPILVADHHQFVELSYYGNASFRNRLVYAASPELSDRYTGNDTGELVLDALSRYTSLRITTYEDFIRTNTRFLLAANADDWLVWQLGRSGYRVSLISEGWQPGLFEVEATGQSKLAKSDSL
jgi:hypothetical protein